MTLADLVNAPTEIVFEGKTYQLTPPTLLQQGEFQRWLEQRVLDGIQRRQYQNPADQGEDRRRFHLDVGSGLYEWGGEIAARASLTQSGLAKLLSIIGKQQGLSEATAKRLIKQKLHETLAAIMSKATKDPKELEAVLAMLGLPKNFFSSASPTRPSTSTPTPAATSPTTSSSDSSTTSATLSAPPG